MKYAFLAVAIAALAVGCASTRPAASGSPAIPTATIGGPTANVSVPNCPSRPPALSTHPGVTSSFVSPGARVVRLCQYYGGNASDPLGLAGERLIANAAMVSSLTRAFNALAKIPAGVVYHCPMSDGSAILAVFGYDGTNPERVVVSLRGCGFARNGTSSRQSTSSFRSRLLALTRP